jgi:beta-glucanase (GH16 family)
MLGFQSLVTVFALLAATSALKPPAYSGYAGKWSDHFDLAADKTANSNKWNVIETANPFNNEWQTYTKNKLNLRHTGEGRLQLIPRRDSKAVRGWTSARIESKYTFTPTAGKITRLESQLRLAGGLPASRKQGIWPAFWLMGQSYRTGTLWPKSGEIDIFENVNGNDICVGVVHCDKAPGGVCNEPIGLPGTTNIGTVSWLTWRVEFDLRKSTWKDQTITWFKNGKKFHQLTGARINNQAVWKTLTAQPLYIIFNVAVGGDFPGAPNGNTASGTTNMMELAYVAHYVSK